MVLGLGVVLAADDAELPLPLPVVPLELPVAEGVVALPLPDAGVVELPLAIAVAWN